MREHGNSQLPDYLNFTGIKNSAIIIAAIIINITKGILYDFFRGLGTPSAASVNEFNISLRERVLFFKVFGKGGGVDF